MLSSVTTTDTGAHQYATAIDALCEIANVSFFRGRFADAERVLRTSLQLVEASDGQQQRLKLLLLYGRFLTVEHLLTRGDADRMFSIIQEAQPLAEASHDQHCIADALSLLGRAHYFSTVVASLKHGISPNGRQDQGDYDQALAYQQQALKLREALHDTRGISESLFQIGIVYERWQQDDQAQAYYAQARQLADQHGHLFEKTEPARHAALYALKKGFLDQALTLAAQALKLREEANFEPYLPLDHLLIRDISQAKGDTTQAQFHTQQASALAEEMGLTTLVSSLPNICDILAAQPERS